MHRYIKPKRIISIVALLLLLGSLSGLLACSNESGYWDGPRTWEPEDVASLERVTQELVAPPFLPEHQQVNTGDPKVVQVRMVVEEKEIEIAPGVFVWAFTFNGSVPGPIIVVHEGDYVDLTLVNPASNQLPHNIGFHAAVGALGGGELTLVAPGEEVVLRFRAVKPGVFIYHCAPGGTMVPWHVVHGMNGAIMVLPREGLKDPAGNSIRRAIPLRTTAPTTLASRTTTYRGTNRANSSVTKDRTPPLPMTWRL